MRNAHINICRAACPRGHRLWLVPENLEFEGPSEKNFGLLDLKKRSFAAARTILNEFREVRPERPGVPQTFTAVQSVLRQVKDPLSPGFTKRKSTSKPLPGLNRLRIKSSNHLKIDLSVQYFTIHSDNITRTTYSSFDPSPIVATHGLYSAGGSVNSESMSLSFNRCADSALVVV